MLISVKAILLAIGLAVAVGGGWFGVHIYSSTHAPLMQELPAGHAVNPPRAAVILSGDSGFDAGMSRGVGERLAADGTGVIGINSHAFFIERRTPAETVTLLADAMARATAMTGARKVLLIGSSYGSDMVQAALPLFPPELRARVAGVVLMVPGQTLFFQISFRERYDLIPPDAPALPTARTLDWVPLLCIYGEQERSSLCPSLQAANVTRVALPGGHYLHHDSEPVYRRIASFAAGLTG